MEECCGRCMEFSTRSFSSADHERVPIFNDICRYLRIETYMRLYYPLLAERGGRELNKHVIKNYIILQKLYYTKNYTTKLHVV